MRRPLHYDAGGQFVVARLFTEADLRDAFRAGWQERNRNPGLKRRPARTLKNATMNAVGGGRYLDQEYVPDSRTYHHSIWLRSAIRKSFGMTGSGR